MNPRTHLVMLLAGTLLLAGCSHPEDDDTDPDPGVNGDGDPNGGDTVTILDFAYHPDTIEVTLGTTVIWTNNDDTPHTASADDESWDAGTLQPEQSDGHTFNDEGEFPYHCGFHPGMTGTVTVTR